MHALLSHAATVGAEQQWRAIGARSAAEAGGFLVASMRRVWGVQAALAQARLISWRVWTVGMDRLPTAEVRRAEGAPAVRALEHATREHAEQFWLGIQPVIRPHAP